MVAEDGQAYLEGLEPLQRSLFDAARTDAPVDEDTSEAFADLLEPFESWIPGLFSWWVTGTEEEWARAAWEALGRRGVLTTAEDAGFAGVLDNAAILVTLSAINNRFQGIRNGEGEDCSWYWAHPDIDQADLEVSDIQVGRWAERRGLGAEDDSEETLNDVLKDAAFSLADKIYATLEAEWGENQLFTSLWTVSQDDAVQPATPEAAFDVMNNPTEDMVATYSWFTNARDI